MSVTEQRYKAVLAVIGAGRTVSEVASEWGVCRQTMHRWLARYEGDGLEGLGNRSSRPTHCPHQTPPAVEVMVLEMRRSHPYWGARRIAFELARKGVEPAPSESAVYRCLVRAAVIDPISRRRRRETWKRWERAAPMELWQLDVVHGFLLADGSSAKALTGVDDHSRFCVSARLMTRERTQAVCDGFSSALKTYGLPSQVLTDNDKVFTGRFAQPPVEVLFDRICRENGIDHILTQPRSPTTTGKIDARPDKPCSSLGYSLDPLRPPCWRFEGSAVDFSRLCDLARAQFDEHDELPGLPIRVSGGTDEGIDVTRPFNSQDVETRADNPFVLAADQFASDRFGQAGGVVLKHGTHLGPTADSFS